MMKAPHIILASALALLVASVASAQLPPPFLLSWGTNGTGPGQFQYPTGVALDPPGNVYVSDQLNRRIQVFGSNGAFLRQWETPNPLGVAMDGQGHVFAVASTQVQKFTLDGTFVSQFGYSGYDMFGQVRCLTTDPQGNVYVGDINNHRIGKFANDGTWIAWLATGTVISPVGLATDHQGHLFVCDEFAYKLMVFTTDGTFLNSWGSSGSGPGQFSSIRSVVVDPQGTVFVTDIGSNRRVQAFTSTGTFLAQWGAPGTGPGQFNGPWGIATDGAGTFYVADASNHRIEKFGQSPVMARSTSWGRVKSLYRH
jgi:sugar lactone lactonase YvrE